MLDIQPQQSQVNQSAQTVQTKQTRTVDVKAVGSKEGLTLTSIFTISATIIVVIFAAMLFILKSSTEAQNQKKIDSIQKVKAELEKSTYKELESKLSDVKAQVAAFEAAQKKSDPTKVLDHLKQLTPRNVKYTSFSVDSANEIKLEGYTTSYYDLAKYLIAVKKDNQLGNSKLGSMSMSTKDGGGIEVRFSLSAKYLGEVTKKDQTGKQKTEQQTQPTVPVGGEVL